MRTRRFSSEEKQLRARSGTGTEEMEGEIGECRHGATTQKKVLVTFDIDGTLIRSSGPSANSLHRGAFSHALCQVFGIQDGDIDVIQHHGQTDPIVLIKTLEYYGIASNVATEKLPDLKSRMIEYFKKHINNIGEGLEILPGVASLLEFLSLKANVAVGLVTGNLEDIAWMKMDGLGIRKFFTIPNFGGFGSDNVDRGELVKIAAQRAEVLLGDFDMRVHVGDTPNDIQAAEYGGALALGVCTGIFAEDQLKKASCGNAIVLPDLTDYRAFMKLLNIEE